jgi:hypothetical protein
LTSPAFWVCCPSTGTDILVRVLLGSGLDISPARGVGGGQRASLAFGREVLPTTSTGMDGGRLLNGRIDVASLILAGFGFGTIVAGVQTHGHDTCTRTAVCRGL